MNVNTIEEDAMFVGRLLELDRLKSLWKRKIASLVVIKGRRRIGKSRLVEEFAKNVKFISFSGLAPSDVITAQDQKDEFARQLARIFQIPIPYSKDWGDLFWHLNHYTQNEKVVILLDEISWMGMRDKTFLAKLKNAWDLNFKKNPNLIFIICGSISSWIEKNILSHTGFVGRIDLVFDLKELSLSESAKFWGNHTISSYEKLKVLSITGGVPKYLEGITPDLNAEEFIRQSCFTKEGFLFREFDQIFNDLFSKRSPTYIKILKSLLDSKMTSLDVITNSLGSAKSGTYSEYMRDLEAAGFVTRHHTWDIKSNKTSKLVQFRLSDHYVRFYLKYIEPNKDRILKDLFVDKSLSTLPGYESMMGLQIENLVIKNKLNLCKILNIPISEIINDGPYFQKSTQRNFGCQIDYLIQSKFNSLYLCEVKFSKNSIKTTVIKEVQEKIKALTYSKRMSIRPILIHVNGVEDSVIEEDFFSNIVDLGDFLI